MESKEFAVPATPIRKVPIPIKTPQSAPGNVSDMNSATNTDRCEDASVSTPKPRTMPKRSSGNALGRRDTPFPSHLFQRPTLDTPSTIIAAVDSETDRSTRFPAMGVLDDSPKKIGNVAMSTKCSNGGKSREDEQDDLRQPISTNTNTPTQKMALNNDTSFDSGSGSLCNTPLTRPRSASAMQPSNTRLGPASTVKSMDDNDEVTLSPYVDVSESQDAHVSQKRRAVEFDAEPEPLPTPITKKVSVSRRDTPAPWKLVQTSDSTHKTLDTDTDENVACGRADTSVNDNTSAAASENSNVDTFAVPDPVSLQSSVHDSERENVDTGFTAPGPASFTMPLPPTSSSEVRNGGEVMTGVSMKTETNQTDMNTPPQTTEQSQKLDVKTGQASFTAPMPMPQTQMQPNVNESDTQEGSFVAPMASASSIPVLTPTTTYKAVSVFPFDYKEPTWSSVPNIAYKIEVLKGGVIFDTISIDDESFFVVGRDPRNHFPMDHPSVSRFHAIIQHRGENDGVYLYDLGSTHGTKLNKKAIKPRTFHRIRIGHTIQFGLSTRLFVLAGPSEIAEEQEQITEDLRQQTIAENHMRLQEKLAIEKQAEKERIESDHVSWGQAEDAVDDEEPDQAEMMLRDGALAKQLFDKDQTTEGNQSDRERRWAKDPKKTLLNFFANESIDYAPDVKQLPKNKGFVIKIQLPIETTTGEWVVVEGNSGRRRDAERQACYNACSTLSQHGLFSSARREGVGKLKRKAYSDDDYYSSDDDEFFDRTGEVQKRRINRIKRLAPDKKMTDERQEVETFDTLKEKLIKLYQRRRVCQRLIREAKEAKRRGDANEMDLDNYVDAVSETALAVDSTKLGLEIKQSEAAEKQFLRLLRVVNPRYDPSVLKEVTSP
eukprot:CFRG6633T1